MKVLYDSEIFTIQKYGGISRYYCDLIEELSSDNRIEPILACKLSNNEYLGTLSESPKIIQANWMHNLRGGLRAGLFVNNCYDRFALQRQRVDLVHLTMPDSTFWRYLRAEPFICTIHDMIYERLPQYFTESEKEYHCVNKRLLAKHASHIITISESTKTDIIDILGIAEEKLSVVNLSSSFSGLSSKKVACLTEAPYILYVGTRDLYKNFNRLFSAFQLLLKEFADLNMVCVGGGKFNQHETTMFQDAGIFSQIHQLSLSDEELKYCYEKAECFVFPSLYEGFGIPLLEAFASKCPIACSNRSSLPEIAGDAALLFDPDNPYQISEAIAAILNSPKLQHSLRERGERRLNYFSRQRQADETFQVYLNSIK